MNNPIPTRNLKSTIHCLCCGGLTIPEPSDYEICHQCGWENDPSSWYDPDNELTANHMSLTTARRNTVETGTYNREPSLHWDADFFLLLQTWPVKATD